MLRDTEEQREDASARSLRERAAAKTGRSIRDGDTRGRTECDPL